MQEFIYDACTAVPGTTVAVVGMGPEDGGIGIGIVPVGDVYPEVG